MFHWILTHFIGGDTGKRESSLMLLSMWAVFTAFIVVWVTYVSPNAEAEVLMTIWKVFTPFVFACWAGAFGLDWAAKQMPGIIAKKAAHTSQPEVRQRAQVYSAEYDSNEDRFGYDPRTLPRGEET